MSPKNFFGLKMQGVIPSLKNSLPKLIVNAIEKEFLNYDFIKERFLSNEKISKIREQLMEKIDNFIQHKVGEKFPIVNMFLTENTKKKVKENLGSRLPQLKPRLVKIHLCLISKK